jgi:diguanylate cyclase (GGDEF)-like protein
VLATRLALALKADAARRGSLALLIAAVVLWASGAIVVTHRTGPLPDFPAPGEILFLAGYLALAGYLVFDSGARARSTLAGWLDVVVICGAAACVASSVLLLPLDDRADDTGSTLLALVYPMLALAFAALVLAQVVLRQRNSLRRALPTVVALLLFALADSYFIGHLSAHGPSLSLLAIGPRMVGFALLVGSACRPAEPRPHAGSTGAGGTVVGAATALATAVLALRPAGALGVYVAIPAALTLLGAGARLTTALHVARRAVEALARSQVDDLTRLPNRRALSGRLEAAGFADVRVALAVLDLDGFKDINDTLGHAAGDHVLQRVGGRIQDAVAPHAFVARLGGDEFGILALGCVRAEMADIARQVQDALSRPMQVDGINVALSASVGIVDCAENAVLDSNELVRRAEVAMYRAKHARSGIAYYDAYHDKFSKAKLRISDELRRGIATGELELWYQPQIDASTLRPCALEALVRWRHPVDGLLTPVAFLPAARRAGLMPLLSQEVVRLAVADIARWHAAGLRLRVAINCAPPELLSGAIVPRLHQAVREAGLPLDQLVLEVTEESFIAERERAGELLQEVRDLGIQVAIDDYGTGFSSLAYLRDLPIDELKLDRTFVSPIGTDERSRMIVASTVQMAQGLGMRTVAEGVEDAATAADLIAIGVDALQGYHISRPLPAGEVLNWIVQWPTFADLRMTATAPSVADPGSTISIRREAVGSDEAGS